MGSNIPMKKGEIGFKSNFAYKKDDIVVLRRVDRNYLNKRKF
jgi:hypothetical protein